MATITSKRGNRFVAFLAAFMLLFNIPSAHATGYSDIVSNPACSTSQTIQIYGASCSHSSTLTMWDTGYAIHYKPVSDQEHEMSGYMYERCTECYERVCSSYPATERYSHSFSSGGTCTECGYNASCSHSNKAYEVIPGYPHYHPYDEQQHSSDTKYQKVCKDCGEVLLYPDDSKREHKYEAHTFNSSGKCSKCGYIRAEEQQPLSISVSRSVSKAEIGANIGATASASGGDGDYSFAWVVTCNGSVITETSLGYGNYFSVIATSAGSYVFTAYVRDGNGNQKSASCSAIRVEEQRPLSISVSSSVSKAEIGANIGATASASGGDGDYSFAWVVTCNGSVIDETSFDYGKYYSVTATNAGSYVFTAYVRDGNGNQKSASCSAIRVEESECPHSSTLTMWDTGYAIHYKPVSDQEHEMSGYMYEGCTECYERVGSSYPATKRYSHSFSSGGTCTECGYNASCSHSNKAYEVIPGYPAYHPYDEQQHSSDTQYQKVCKDCGEVLLYPDDSKREHKYEAHTFNSSGKCSKCGYIRAEEQQPLSISVSSSVSKAEIGANIGATASASGGDGDYSFAWVVTCNGSVIDETSFGYGKYYSVTATNAGSYVFTAYVRDGNGSQRSASCGAISVQSSHRWETVTSVTYINPTETGHETTTVTYQKCIDCGEQTKPTISTVIEAHHPDYRDYWREHPHQLYSHCKECGYKSAVKHYNTANGKVQGADTCCLCHGHSWQYNDLLKENNQWYMVCSNCGLKTETDEPTPSAEPHNHSVLYTLPASTHPHEVEAYCACGFHWPTGTTIQVSDCEECKKVILAMQQQQAEQDLWFLNFEDTNDIFWNQTAEFVTNGILESTISEFAQTTWSTLVHPGDEGVKVIKALASGNKDQVYITEWESLLIDTLKGYYSVAEGTTNNQLNIFDYGTDAADFILDIAKSRKEVELEAIRGLLEKAIHNGSGSAANWYSAAKDSVLSDLSSIQNAKDVLSVIGGVVTFYNENQQLQLHEQELNEFAQLLLDYNDNLEILQQIENSTNNELLKQACRNVASDMTALISDPQRYVKSDHTQYIGEQATGMLLDTLASASMVTGIASTAAGFTECFSNLDATHTSGLELQMLSVLDASIKDDAFRAATNNNPSDYYLTELYRVLQIRGLTQNKDYVQNYSHTPGLNTSDLHVGNVQSFLSQIDQQIGRNVEFQNNLLVSYLQAQNEATWVCVCGNSNINTVYCGICGRWRCPSCGYYSDNRLEKACQHCGTRK